MNNPSTEFFGIASGPLVQSDLTDTTVTTVKTARGPVTIIGTSLGEDLAVWNGEHYLIPENVQTAGLPAAVEDAVLFLSTF